MNTFRVGNKVRIKINGIGYRSGTIVGTGLNSFWIEYRDKRYLVATKNLVEWN